MPCTASCLVYFYDHFGCMAFVCTIELKGPAVLYKPILVLNDSALHCSGRLLKELCDAFGVYSVSIPYLFRITGHATLEANWYHHFFCRMYLNSGA